ncbi:hypothetical protein [Acidipila sp. EB88]|uniref:hypothetical protein n=1 Tax=Acidipila sp. EB88 TaxID=2305226 RepID=UPI000F602E8B|nr:hypothetical protein [Acidipila sp. EB88]RRA47887.1 hypothetical protein D1Y84_05830 [Acidipila sp. EB88]
MLLRHFGIEDLLNRYERPKYVKKVVRAYSKSEIGALVAGSSAKERALWHFFLGTGAREREVATACWRDIDLEAGILKVQANIGFSPRD